VATLCIWRGSPTAHTPLHFSLVAVEHLPPRSASFTVTDYKVPARAFINKYIRVGHNPLLTNYVGHIETKPVYDTSGPLESMDDILIHTEMGVHEVTTEEWGELRVYPATWGTTEKDRRWIIR
jgi:hypothetical protein